MEQEESRPEALDSLIDTGLLELEKLLGIDHDDPSVQALLKAESSYRHETENDSYNTKPPNSVWKDSTVKANSTIRDINAQDKHDISEVKQDGVKGRARKTGLRSRTTGTAKANASVHKQTNSTVTHEEHTDGSSLDKHTKGDVRDTDNKGQKDLIKGETQAVLKTEEQMKDGVKKDIYGSNSVPQSNGQEDFMMDTVELKPSALESSFSETNVKTEPTVASDAVDQLNKSNEAPMKENSLYEGDQEVMKTVNNDSVKKDPAVSAKVEAPAPVPPQTSTRKRRITATDTPAKVGSASRTIQYLFSSCNWFVKLVFLFN